MNAKPVRRVPIARALLKKRYPEFRQAVVRADKAISPSTIPRRRVPLSNPFELIKLTKQVRKAYDYLNALRNDSHYSQLSIREQRALDRDFKFTTRTLARLNFISRRRQTNDTKLSKPLNNEAFVERVYEVLRSRKKNEPVSYAMIDKDYFGKVNKKFGHNVGDFVLKQFAEVFGPIAKKEGLYFGRFGGDEFKLCGRISPERMSNILQFAAKRYFELVRNPAEFGIKPNTNWNGWKIPTLSIGISSNRNILKKDAALNEQFDILDRNARLAQQEVKLRGRNGIKIAD